jgi:hypothetical protein
VLRDGRANSRQSPAALDARTAPAHPAQILAAALPVHCAGILSPSLFPLRRLRQIQFHQIRRPSCNAAAEEVRVLGPNGAVQRQRGGHILITVRDSLAGDDLEVLAALGFDGLTQSRQLIQISIGGATGTLRRARIAGRDSRASSKAVSGAKNSTCAAYLRNKKSTRAPSTARIRIFASRTSTGQPFFIRRSRRSFLKSARIASSLVPAAAISSCIFSPATRSASRST